MNVRKDTFLLKSNVRQTHMHIHTHRHTQRHTDTHTQKYTYIFYELQIHRQANWVSSSNLK